MIEDDASPESAANRPRRAGPLATVWNGVTAVVGAVMGVLPHVLHHVGLLGGAALVTGATGNVLFAVLGLIFSFPFLRRLYRRFRTWKAPAVALTIFAVMFSVSAFVIGPALGTVDPDPGPPPVQSPTPVDHDAHHGDQSPT